MAHPSTFTKPKNVRQGSIVGPALIVLDHADPQPAIQSHGSSAVPSGEAERRRTCNYISRELLRALYARLALALEDYDECHSAAHVPHSHAALVKYSHALFADANDDGTFEDVTGVRRMVTLRIHSAVGLKDKGSDGDSVLCDVQVMGSPDTPSAVAVGGTRVNPEFNWLLELPAASVRDVVRVRLWTRPASPKGKPHFLGQVDFRMDDVAIAGNYVDGEFDLHGRSSRSHVAGRVNVGISYVLDADSLPAIPEGVEPVDLLGFLIDLVLALGDGSVAESSMSPGEIAASTLKDGHKRYAPSMQQQQQQQQQQGGKGQGGGLSGPSSASQLKGVRAIASWDADLPLVSRDILRQYARVHSLSEGLLRLSYLSAVKKQLARDHIVRLTGAAVVLSDCVRGTRDCIHGELSQSTDEMGNPTTVRIAFFAEEQPPFLPVACTASASQSSQLSASSSSLPNTANLCLDLPAMGVAWRRGGVVEAQLVATRIFELQSMIAQLVSEYSLAFTPLPNATPALASPPTNRADHVIVLNDALDAGQCDVSECLDPLDCLSFVLRLFNMAQEVVSVAFAGAPVFSLTDCIAVAKKSAIGRIVAEGESNGDEMAVVALNVGDFIAEDLARDEKHFAPVFARNGVDLLATSTRLLCELHTDMLRGLQKERPVENIAVLSQLYSRVKTIGDAYAKYSEGPHRLYPLVVAWLEPLVNAWFANIISETVRVWVCKAVSEDDLRPVSARVLHSSSAIDVVSCIFGCAEPLKKLEWPQDIADRTIPLGLSNVTADQFRTYSSWLQDQCLANAVAWGDVEARGKALARMCVALNNIAFAFEEMRSLCDLIGATSITSGSGAIMLTPAPSRVWGPKASAASVLSSLQSQLSNEQQRGSSASGGSGASNPIDPHRIVLSRSRQMAYYVRQQSAELDGGGSLSAVHGGAVAGVIIEALQTLNRTMDDIVGVLMKRIEPVILEHWRYATGLRGDRPSVEHIFNITETHPMRSGEAASATAKGFRSVIEKRFAPLKRNTPPVSPTLSPADPLSSSSGGSYLATSLGKALKVLRWIGDRPSSPQSPRMNNAAVSAAEGAILSASAAAGKPSEMLEPMLTFLGDSLTSLADHLYEDVFLHSLRDVWDVVLRTLDGILWNELAAPIGTSMTQRPDSAAATAALRKLDDISKAVAFLRRYFISNGNGIAEEEADSFRHAQVMRAIDLHGMTTRTLVRAYCDSQADALAVKLAAGQALQGACFGVVDFKMGIKEIMPGQTSGPLRLSINITRVGRLFVGSSVKGRGIFVVAELLPPSNVPIGDAADAQTQQSPQSFLLFQSLPFRRSPLIAFDDRRGSESPNMENRTAVQFDEAFPFDVDPAWVTLRGVPPMDCTEVNENSNSTLLPLLRIAVYCGRVTKDTSSAAKSPAVELVGETIVRVPAIDYVPINVVREYSVPLDPTGFGETPLLLKTITARRDVDAVAADFLRQRDALLSGAFRSEKEGALNASANGIHTVLRKRFSRSSVSATAVHQGAAARLDL